VSGVAPPLAVLLELTHRCPLQCPYCSNPLQLLGASAELDTDAWLRVIDQAAELGALQVHFSGGEPMARGDLPRLVRRARERNLYSNLITSAVMLSDARLDELLECGLDHVQISLQDVEATSAEWIGGFKGAQERKIAAARAVHRRNIALTLNFVIHRHNAERVADMIELGESLGAGRVEVAHVQYYGWALENRSALLPTRAQLDGVTAAVEAARARLAGRMLIDYVTPDYYAVRPKACMGGWGRRFLNVSPAGLILPCHAAESLPDMAFPSIQDTTLADAWNHSAAFMRFRGTDWMPEPCRSCDQREVDWGGCRCQAYALVGDVTATDPVCELSPIHQIVREKVFGEQARDWKYRRIAAR
jgi:PqqA peptide cyclase